MNCTKNGGQTRVLHNVNG